MRTTLNLMVALAGTLWTAGSTAAAAQRPDRALVASVRGCADHRADQCRDLASNLAARLAPDRALGLRLGMIAATAVEHPERMVAGVAESCRAGYDQACVTLARVLDRLFTGDDARLERSSDRLLAHELASRLITAGSTPAVALSPKGSR